MQLENTAHAATLRNTMTSKKSSRYLLLLAHLGALITVSCWGTSFISSKVLMEQGGFTPVETYIYRFALAYIIMLCLTFKKIFSNNWKDELQFIVCGMCAGSIYFITENYALQHTTTGNVSLLSAMSPIFTTLLMALVFKLRINMGVALGSVIAFIGVGCIIFSHGEGFEIRPAGDILALSSAISWAVYTVAVRRLIPNYSSMFITRKLFFYGVLTALPLLLIQKEPTHLALLFDFSQPHYLLNLLFLVIMCSIVAYLLWNEAMKVLGAVTANNYIYMQPLVTMIAAYFVFGEHVYLLGYIGCVLIIGGLVISDKVSLEFPRFKKRSGNSN